MRLIMMGTGPFGLPTLRELCRGPHELLAVVTQPLRETRGKPEPPTSPIRVEATQRGLPILDPLSINTPEAQAELKQLRPDLLIVVDYGQILARETLAAARLGGVNLHGSQLPKYRGAAPIHWAIYHGDQETGVSVIHMTPRVDAGPVLEQASTPIEPDETAPQLENRLAELGAPLVVRALERLQRGDTAGIPQDPKLASPARRLRKTDGEIDWSRPAVDIHNQVRALEPWPRTSTWWHRAGGSLLRLILGPTSVIASPEPAPPGSVVRVESGLLVVATGDGCLAIGQVQPAGKRMLPVAEFLRGYPVAVGDRLGPEK